MSVPAMPLSTSEFERVVAAPHVTLLVVAQIAPRVEPPFGTLPTAHACVASVAHTPCTVVPPASCMAALHAAPLKNQTAGPLAVVPTAHTLPGSPGRP